MNRKKIKITVGVLLAVLLIASIVAVIMMIDRIQKGNNGGNAPGNETVTPTEDPEAVPSEIPEGSVLVWKLSECTTRRNIDGSTTRTVYEYNGDGQCVTATVYDRVGNVSERYRFQYLKEESAFFEGENAAHTIVIKVEEPDNTSREWKSVTVDKYEGGHLFSHETGRATDPEEITDFIVTSRDLYKYDRDGTQTECLQYRSQTTDILRLTGKQYMVKWAGSEIRECWTENYTGGEPVYRTVTYADDFGVFLIDSYYKEKDESPDLRLVPLREFGNDKLYEAYSGEKCRYSAEIITNADGSRKYIVRNTYNPDSPEIDLVREYDAKGRETLVEYYNGGAYARKKYEYDGDRLTKWYRFYLRNGKLMDGRIIEYDADGRVTRIVGTSAGEWGFSFDEAKSGKWDDWYHAEFDEHGNLKRRVTIGEGEEQFFYEYDENDNCIGYRHQSREGDLTESMTYIPVVITEEQVKATEVFYFPTSDPMPEGLRGYEETELMNE